jgi:hypothetical protein
VSSRFDTGHRCNKSLSAGLEHFETRFSAEPRLEVFFGKKDA